MAILSRGHQRSTVNSYHHNQDIPMCARHYHYYQSPTPRNDKIAREAAVEATPMPNDAGAILSPATCKRHITKHPLMPPRNLRCSTHNKHGC